VRHVQTHGGVGNACGDELACGSAEDQLDER
jgi:hypothetical protein